MVGIQCYWYPYLHTETLGWTELLTLQTCKYDRSVSRFRVTQSSLVIVPRSRQAVGKIPQIAFTNQIERTFLILLLTFLTYL